MLRLFVVFQLAALLLAASIHSNLITFRGEAFVVNELACSRKERGEKSAHFTFMQALESQAGGAVIRPQSEGKQPNGRTRAEVALATLARTEQTYEPRFV